MTDRKPVGMSFTSWIDQQISEAAERGAFDDLPGAGRPLPRRDDFDGQAWLADYVRRQGGSIEDTLPTPLRLRKQRELLAAAVPEFSSQEQVREAAAELNEQIIEWRKLPQDPPIFVPLVDTEGLVKLWLTAREAGELNRAPEAAEPPAQPP
jgi:DnaJ-like protein